MVTSLTLTDPDTSFVQWTETDGSRYVNCTRAQTEIFNRNRLAGPGHTDAGDLFQFGKAWEDAYGLLRQQGQACVCGRWVCTNLGRGRKEAIRLERRRPTRPHSTQAQVINANPAVWSSTGLNFGARQLARWSLSSVKWWWWWWVRCRY